MSGKYGWIALVTAVATILLSAAAFAEEPISGDKFEAYVGGRTVTYAQLGRVYGLEQYLPGRKVIWRQLDGECQEGSWFESDGLICFQYGSSIPLQCWQFYQNSAGLSARSDDDPKGLWLYEVRRSTDPIGCPAPYFGS